MKTSRQVNFDNIAPVYDTLAAIFGGNIRKSQQYFLSQIPENARILIIGGGSGWILEEIFSVEKSFHRITYLEASATMLDLSKEKYKNYESLHPGRHFSPIEWVKGTENNIPENNFYDVVITNFFLDLFNQTTLLEVMKKLSISLRKEGIWLFSDFNISEKPVDSWWQRIMIRSMYLFFKITCQLDTIKLPDIEQAFQQLAFKKVHSKSFFRNMIVSRVYYKIPYS